MHVIIAGCGRVGSALAENLDRLEHSVAVVDKNARAFERLKPGFNGRKIVGFVFDKDVLEEAGINEAGAFASVTSGDNSNIVSARMAREHYRVQRVVARIYDPRRAQIYQRLGIETVATVRWTTDQILSSLLPDQVPVEHTIGNGEVVVTAIAAPPGSIGKSAFTADLEGHRRVVAISRFGVTRVPDKSFTIQEDDVLYVAVVRGEAGGLGDALEHAGEPE